MASVSDEHDGGGRPPRSERPLRGRFAGTDVTGELLRARAEDRRREDARAELFADDSATGLA